jgi:hypothetical protein
MHYIQRKDARQLETVDEFDTYKEARAMLAEYRMADPAATYYISSRPCKAWREEPQQ